MKLHRRIRPKAAAFVVTTVITAVLLVWQTAHWASESRAEDRRAEAVETAKAQVLDLTTLDSASVKRKLKALGSRVTGDFKRQFDGFSETFAAVVKEEEVKASGSVKAAAISSYDDEQAVVLVASSAQISNAGQEQSTQRDYRMKVSLNRVDGAWLISGMEFVQ